MSSACRIAVKNVFEFAEMYQKIRDGATPSRDWKLIFRIFNVVLSKGEMYVPETFYLKVNKWFGKLDDPSMEEAVVRVEEQDIVRIINKWTFEQTLFNPLRSDRPMNNKMPLKSFTTISDELQELPEKCDFCSPLNYTAIDLWGRIERDTCMTASNCAKYDGMHSLIIFKDHSPLKYTKDKLNDVFSVTEEWLQCANEKNDRAVFPMLTWNCRERAGASQNHGHCHLLLAEDFHYGRYEFLHNVSKQYTAANPGNNYFLDLIAASKALGLVKTIGYVNIITNLTPGFQHDFLVIGWNFDREFRDAMDSAMKTLIQRFESLTFNVGILFPPLQDGRIRKRLDLVDMDTKLSKPGAPMPFIGYLVDRSDASNGKFTSDVCGMKLHGSNVVATDPFEIGKGLRHMLNGIAEKGN